MPDNTNLTVEDLSIEDLQKAVAEQSVGRDVDRKEEVGPLTEGSTEEMKFKPVYEQEREKYEASLGLNQTEGEPKPEEPKQEVKEEPATEVDEPEKHRALSNEELETLFVKGKVNGEEREYSLKELLAIQQTQDAAKQKLEEYKELLKTARESLKPEQPQTQPQVEEEYLTDEERKTRELQQKLEEISNQQRLFQSSILASEEENYIRSAFARDNVSTEQAAGIFKQIVEQYPKVKEFAAELFDERVIPQTKSDLERRKAMFDTIWEYKNLVQMPQIVQKAAQQAKEEGETQAKIDAKRNLTNVPSGAPVDTREPSRNERIAQAAQGGTDEDWAKLVIEGDVLKHF